MSQVADRYASALYDVCQQKGTTAKVLDGLVALGDIMVASPDIEGALTSPLISNDDKVKTLKAAMAANLTPELESFFQLIAKNNRFSSIPGIVTAFKNQVEQTSGVMSGVVRSATELSADEKKNLQKVIEDKLERKVQLSYTLDKDMIGGVEARVGSYIFEDSIKSHMQNLNDFITRRVQ